MPKNPRSWTTTTSSKPSERLAPGVLDRPVSKEIAGGGAQVRQEPAVMDARRHERGNVCVEADAGHIQKNVVAELARIDYPRG